MQQIGRIINYATCMLAAEQNMQICDSQRDSNAAQLLESKY